MRSPLAIVTATTNIERARPCIESWRAQAKGPLLIVVVRNGHDQTTTRSRDFDIVVNHTEYLGSVPAFQRGVNLLLEFAEPPTIIACLHDDFEIRERDWDQKVLRHFERRPECGLAGFGGAVGLGADQIYQTPYDPMQLARVGFRSNLQDAEAHGLRSLLSEQVACLDGFSQVGRREFWDGWRRQRDLVGDTIRGPRIRPWDALVALGIVHHLYDSLLGCLAKRAGWETWYLPLRGQHYGGRTAVGDAGYGDWAKTQLPEGDHGFWEAAHRAGYEEFRAELPIRL